MHRLGRSDSCPVFLIQGRLNEMLSHIRLQSQVSLGRAEERYELTMDMQQEIKLVSILTV